MKNSLKVNDQSSISALLNGVILAHLWQKKLVQWL